MTEELIVLSITALSLGFIHTLLGPDHYIPFIAMARVGKWTLAKTIIITILCGIGHILSSVLLGVIGIAFGIALLKLTAIESFRGELAGWFLLIFGIIYFLWGLYTALKNKHHEPFHVLQEYKKANLTPWILFTIFVFGPCEPLIPLIMYPAAKGSLLGLSLLTGIFGITTISTMLFIVLIGYFGINLINMEKLERYMHALAGATILLCGIAIKFFGL